MIAKGQKKSKEDAMAKKIASGADGLSLLPKGHFLTWKRDREVFMRHLDAQAKDEDSPTGEQFVPDFQGAAARPLLSKGEVLKFVFTSGKFLYSLLVVLAFCAGLALVGAGLANIYYLEREKIRHNDATTSLSKPKTGIA